MSDNLIIVIKEKDHVGVHIAPHGANLVANNPEECFKQHLNFLYEKFLEEYNRVLPVNGVKI